MEHIHSDVPSIEYTKELLQMKMEIQRAVIEHFCQGDIHNREKVEAWIQEFSSSFRRIFERRFQTEDDFIQRIQTEKERVVAEIVEELG